MSNLLTSLIFCLSYNTILFHVKLSFKPHPTSNIIILSVSVYGLESVTAHQLYIAEGKGDSWLKRVFLILLIKN